MHFAGALEVVWDRLIIDVALAIEPASEGLDIWHFFLFHPWAV